MPSNWKPKQTMQQKKQYMFHYNKSYRDRMVNIGAMVKYWKAIKEESGCLNDPEVAKLLIECYYESKGRTVDFSHPTLMESINSNAVHLVNPELHTSHEKENDLKETEMSVYNDAADGSTNNNSNGDIAHDLSGITTEPELNINNNNNATTENNKETTTGGYNNHSMVNHENEKESTDTEKENENKNGTSVFQSVENNETKTDSGSASVEAVDANRDGDSEVTDHPLDLSDRNEIKVDISHEDEETQDVDLMSLKFKVKMSQTGRGKVIKASKSKPLSAKTKSKAKSKEVVENTNGSEQNAKTVCVKRSLSTENQNEKPTKKIRKAKPKESKPKGSKEPNTKEEKPKARKCKRKSDRNSTTDNDDEDESDTPTQAPWIHIKLEDHPDKYTIENVESFERRNRGAEVFECMYSCLICKQFKSVGKEVFEEHLEFHVNKVYECSKCQYIGFSHSDMYRHKGMCCKVKKGREYVCHLCGAKLISKGDKVDHMGMVHNIPELPCRWCKEMFTTRNFRKKHYRAVHTEQCQYCDSCKTGLSKLSRVEYKKHIETCVPGHQCQYCGKMFTRKQGLDSHVTFTHLKVRKYACKLCAYTATTPEKLKLHVLAHQGIRPYSCDQCPFTCVQPFQLKSHMRTHTGEKPFKCDQCSYAAAWNVQLKEHKKAHTSETAVMCHYCNVVFKNGNLLTSHQKKGQCLQAGTSVEQPSISAVCQQTSMQRQSAISYSPQLQQDSESSQAVYSPQTQLPQPSSQIVVSYNPQAQQPPLTQPASQQLHASFSPQPQPQVAYSAQAQSVQGVYSPQAQPAPYSPPPHTSYSPPTKPCVVTYSPQSQPQQQAHGPYSPQQQQSQAYASQGPQAQATYSHIPYSQ